MVIVAAPSASPRQRAAPVWLPLAATLVLVVALATRLSGLDRFATTDEASFWLARSARFVAALQAGDWRSTYQSYHPGVTIMWLGGVAMALGGALEPATTDNGGSTLRVAPDRFLRALASARLPLALLATAVVLSAFAALARLLGLLPATLASLALALDPFLLAHSRLLHLDATVSGLMLVALLAALARWRGGGWGWWLLSAIAAGLALLTKAPSLYLLAAVPALALTLRLVLARPRLPLRLLLELAVWLATAGALTLMLWPALWVDPLGTLVEALVRQREVGSTPHELPNYFAGQVVADPGPLFYPVAFALRSTPLTLLGCLAAVLVGAVPRLAPPRLRWVTVLLLLYALGFAALVTLAAKKFDRYLLPALTALDVAAALAWVACVLALWRWRPRAGALLASLLGLGFLAQSAHGLSLHPYELAYANPLAGGGGVAERALLVGWGEGLDQAAAYLNQQPGAERLRVVCEYAGFAPLFRGRTLPARRFEEGVTDYVVLYANQWQRHLYPELEAALAGLSPTQVVRLDGMEVVRIYAVPRPEVDRPLHARFADQIELDGFALAREGERLQVTVRWRALASPAADYKVFLHVLDAVGQRLSQRDRPLAERTPTSRWLAGDEVVRRYEVPVPRQPTRGPLTLVAGLYDGASGQRLRLVSTSGERAAIDDAVVLATLPATD